MCLTHRYLWVGKVTTIYDESSYMTRNTWGHTFIAFKKWILPNFCVLVKFLHTIKYSFVVWSFVSFITFVNSGAHLHHDSSFLWDTPSGTPAVAPPALTLTCALSLQPFLEATHGTRRCQTSSPAPQDGCGSHSRPGCPHPRLSLPSHISVTWKRHVTRKGGTWGLHPVFEACD